MTVIRVRVFIRMNANNFGYSTTFRISKINNYITRDVYGKWSQYVHTVLKFKFEESGKEGRR